MDIMADDQQKMVGARLSKFLDYKRYFNRQDDASQGARPVSRNIKLGTAWHLFRDNCCPVSHLTSGRRRQVLLPED
jgi:hypothetical protein